MRMQLVAAVALCVPSYTVSAASFDCAKARTYVERQICEDSDLSRLDEELAAQYRNAYDKADIPRQVQKSQREWLRRRNGCESRACVKEAYVERLHHLRTVYSFERCAFQDLILPADLEVIAVASIRGRMIEFPIDDSGYPAWQIDLVANYRRPVALILYSPRKTIWNLSWTPETRVVAVLATGPQRQVIAGLDPAVPVHLTIGEDQYRCGDFRFGRYGSGELSGPAQLSARRLFGQSVQGHNVHATEEESLVIGQSVVEGGPTISSPANQPAKYFVRPSKPGDPKK